VSSADRAGRSRERSDLTGRPIRCRAAGTGALRVGAPDVLSVGEPLLVDVTVDDASRHAVRVTLTDELGRLHSSCVPALGESHATVAFTELAPGAYTIDVNGLNP